MPRLDFPAYLQHLRDESLRFREVLTGCDPTTRVPGCPEWDAADLVWHLGEVQWFWARTIRTRPEAADEETPGPARPDTYDGLLAFFDESSADLVAQLQAADPAEQAWSWAPEQTVGFSYRRQAHEALIHRLDAEQTAGEVTPLDAALSADGVAELFDVMYGGTPPWGRFDPLPHYVRFDLTDTGDALWVQPGRFTGTDPDDGVSHDVGDIRLVGDPGVEAAAVVSGSAAAVNTWLWKRGDDSEIHVSGNREIYAHFRDAVSDPLN